jgi:toxin-antitoxin system PIN domain toxin
MRHLGDTNVFLAVAVGQHANHRVAARWFRGLAEHETAAFCRATQTSFLRLLTRPIAENYTPLSNRQAWSVYDQLCQDDAMCFAEEPAGLEAIWRRLARPATASPKVWMDAYLAAFAIAGGLRLTTLDQDFRKFEADGLDLLLLPP